MVHWFFLQWIIYIHDINKIITRLHYFLTNLNLFINQKEAQTIFTFRHVLFITSINKITIKDFIYKTIPIQFSHIYIYIYIYIYMLWMRRLLGRILCHCLLSIKLHESTGGEKYRLFVWQHNRIHQNWNQRRSAK